MLLHIPTTFKTHDPDNTDTCGITKGFKVVRIDALKDNAVVGYIKLGYVPKIEWEKRFANNILNYANKFKGWCFDLETLQGIQSYCYPWNYNGKITREDVIEKAWNKFQHSFKNDFQYHVDKPLVDYIEVNDKHKRQGIGTSLYIEAAKWCASHNMVLHASSIQSHEAQQVWRYLATKKECKINEKLTRKTLQITS